MMTGVLVGMYNVLHYCTSEHAINRVGIVSYMTLWRCCELACFSCAEDIDWISFWQRAA